MVNAAQVTTVNATAILLLRQIIDICIKQVRTKSIVYSSMYNNLQQCPVIDPIESLSGIKKKDKESEYYFV